MNSADTKNRIWQIVTESGAKFGSLADRMRLVERLTAEVVSICAALIDGRNRAGSGKTD